MDKVKKSELLGFWTTPVVQYSKKYSQNPVLMSIINQSQNLSENWKTPLNYLVLYIIAILSKLKHTSVAWNNLTSTDYNEVQDAQNLSESLYYKLMYLVWFSPDYPSVLIHPNSTALHSRQQNHSRLFSVTILRERKKLLFFYRYYLSRCTYCSN